ncbi:hypothetical protein BE17_43025 [Sorangium cellulosum]|uniref:Peptidase S8/S53 domain-containing protein n=1 Tax=Sorangium cellulosum TaxID=56 RepID=A0A150RUM6_SORCE|nr:hypothetical protein BE17_43025 [Sorangium cellulosum]
MPCSDHQESVDRKCGECFLADLLAFDPQGKLAESNAKKLNAWLSELELTPSQEDLCLPIIASLNLQLKGVHLGDVLQPDEIQDFHRTRYRERMGMAGAWIGFYELEVLARLFNVQFDVAVPAGRRRWRLYQIGGQLLAPQVIPELVLRWTGNHYDVGVIRHPDGDGVVLGTVRETNGLGNCGLEAFLLLLLTRPTVSVPLLLQIQDQPARGVLTGFQQVMKQSSKGKVNANSELYATALSTLREIMVGEMSDPEVNAAILAEGVLPQSRKESDRDVVASWQDLMNVDEARRLALERSSLSPICVGVTDSGFLETHDLLRDVATLEGQNAEELKNKEHGTLCAGLIAGTAWGEFLGGVARGDRFGKLNVMLRLRVYGSGTSRADVKNWKTSIQDRNVRVVSMSYGTVGDRLADTGNAIQELSGEGAPCVFVIAAGNEGQNRDFLVLGMAAIVVTATTVEKTDKGRYVERLIDDCNRGLGVTVCAPGSGTVGDEDGLLTVKSTSASSKLGDHSNTSAATPMVAGVAALMLAVNPALTPGEVKEILCLTAVQIDPGNETWTVASVPFTPLQLPSRELAERPYSIKYGFGRVDAAAAVAMAIRRITPIVQSGKSGKSEIVISSVKRDRRLPSVIPRKRDKKLK